LLRSDNEIGIRLAGMQIFIKKYSMNSIDRNDSIKSELQENTTHYEDELNSEMIALGTRTRELINKALIIGGSVALAYLVYRQLRGKKKSGILNTLMVTAVSAMATDKGKDLLIAGKNKLTEFLGKENS
jgi:hypothetical protein